MKFDDRMVQPQGVGSGHKVLEKLEHVELRATATPLHPSTIKPSCKTEVWTGIG